MNISNRRVQQQLIYSVDVLFNFYRDIIVWLCFTHEEEWAFTVY